MLYLKNNIFKMYELYFTLPTPPQTIYHPIPNSISPSTPNLDKIPIEQIVHLVMRIIEAVKNYKKPEKPPSTSTSLYYFY